jgi:hypothetical protein
VVNGGLPDKRPMDSEVLVHKDISQSDYVAPGYTAIPFPDFRRQTTGGFTGHS